MTLTNEDKRKIIDEEILRKQLDGKSSIVAVTLSGLIPGLGDLYCGSFIKAFVFFGLDCLCFILLFFMGLGAFLYAPVWVAGLISAWLSVSKAGKRKIRKVNRSIS
jgi:hypothetical protein